VRKTGKDGSGQASQQNACSVGIGGGMQRAGKFIASLEIGGRGLSERSEMFAVQKGRSLMGRFLTGDEELFERGTNSGTCDRQSASSAKGIFADDLSNLGFTKKKKKKSDSSLTAAGTIMTPGT